MAFSDVISHARLFLFLLTSCGTLGRRSQNPGGPRNANWKSLPYPIKWSTICIGPTPLSFSPLTYHSILLWLAEIWVGVRLMLWQFNKKKQIS